MRIHVRSRDLAAVAALLYLSAPCAIAQPAVQSAGPTRIKIAAGTVSAEDTRAGLLGAWEPDADLGLPPGSNHTIYLADGMYINPFRNVALIGFWSATADVLTSTPFDIRQLATGAPAPELKDVFKQIAWDKPMAVQFAWLTPDRFQEKSRQEATRRAKPFHDVAAVHHAVVTDLLRGSWTRPGGATVVFESDGTFREPAASGTYDFDAADGVLRRTNTGADAASGAARVLQSAARAPSRLQWTSRDSVSVDGERWVRQSRATDTCTTCMTAGRGFLGVGTPPSGATITRVHENGPAANVGLRAGDVIAKLDGVVVQNAAALSGMLAKRKPGDRVEIELFGVSGPGSTRTATLNAGDKGEASLGVGLAFAGAIVTQIQPGSPAERVGMQVGDLIFAINDRDISDGNALVTTMQSFAAGTEVVIKTVSNGRSINYRVTLSSVPQ